MREIGLRTASSTGCFIENFDVSPVSCPKSSAPATGIVPCACRTTTCGFVRMVNTTARIAAKLATTSPRMRSSAVPTMWRYVFRLGPYRVTTHRFGLTEHQALGTGRAKCEFSGCCRVSCLGLLSWNGTSLESGAMPVLVPDPVARSCNRTEELPGESTR